MPVHASKYDWAAHNRARDALALSVKEASLLLPKKTEKPDLVVEGTQERPADVYLPAEGGHGLGGASSVGLGACVDVVGVRSLRLARRWWSGGCTSRCWKSQNEGS